DELTAAGEIIEAHAVGLERREQDRHRSGPRLLELQDAAPVLRPGRARRGLLGDQLVIDVGEEDRAMLADLDAAQKVRQPVDRDRKAERAEQRAVARDRLRCGDAGAAARRQAVDVAPGWRILVEGGEVPE